MRNALIYGAMIVFIALIIVGSRSPDMREIVRHLGRISVRWLLWSPRNAGFALFAIFAVIVLVGNLGHTAAGSSNKAKPHSPPSVTPRLPVAATPSIPTTTTSASLHSATPTPTPTPPVNSAITITAMKFTQNWIKTAAQPTWSTRLAPYSTDSLIVLLRHTDPARVPASKITGPATVGILADGHVQVLIKTDKGTAQLVLIDQHDSWRVDSITMS